VYSMYRVEDGGIFRGNCYGKIEYRGMNLVDVTA
jgi:hypothetical protein